MVKYQPALPGLEFPVDFPPLFGVFFSPRKENPMLQAQAISKMIASSGAIVVVYALAVVAKLFRPRG